MSVPSGSYAVVIERMVEEGIETYSAYLPGVPGCVATGHTFDEVKANIGEAFALYESALQELDLPLKAPTIIIDSINQEEISAAFSSSSHHKK